jgi:hypothetical protein
MPGAAKKEKPMTTNRSPKKLQGRRIESCKNQSAKIDPGIVSKPPTAIKSGEVNKMTW